MKKTLKRIFYIIWHVLVAIAFCCFIVLPFLHNAIGKTLGQWIWYPSLAIFLVYSFIPNKKLKEQSKFVQISSSGGIWQLLFIISGIFVINYYDTNYNWYWFAFAIIAVSIPIGCITVKAWAESKNTYSTEQVKAANVRLGKYIMFYWLIDLFYMACFNQWHVLQFVFGGLAMLIVFYSLTVTFLSEIKTNKWLLLTDFILGIGLTVYLIYIIPNDDLRNIIIPIVSAVYGGLLTLVGVAWTIRHTQKEQKEEEIKKSKPIFTFNMLLDPLDNITGKKVCFDDNLVQYPCNVTAEIENSDQSVFSIEKVYHDNKWWTVEGNRIVLPNKVVIFDFNFSTDVNNLFMEVKDTLGNSYYYEIKVLNINFVSLKSGDKNPYKHTIRELKEISLEEIIKRTFKSEENQ